MWAFSRVVCGVDGSPRAQEAAREAACLAPEGAHMFLVEVVSASRAATAVAPGAATVRTTAVLEAAHADLAMPRAVIRHGVAAATTVCVGSPEPMLVNEAVRLEADAIAIGSHGHGRSAGVLLGSVATLLIHRAPCSVLVARATPSQPFPRSIAVGVDGSEHALDALQKGRELARRIGVPLRVLHVLDGGVPRGVLHADIDEEVEELTVTWSVAEGLSAHVSPPDLLIVGSRGLRGIRALGSASEAIAHRAPSSVLIVRTDQPDAG